LNFEYFIAKQLIKKSEDKISISAPIIKIAIAAIALGLVMMLVAIATTNGLQNKIREKITAFNGHVQITNYDNNNSDVSVLPVSKNQDFYPKFETLEGIDHIQAVATKGGVIRTEETFEGIVAKGVGADFDWRYFEEYLVAGRLPNYKGKLNNEVLISSIMANRLKLKLEDKFSSIFFKDEDPNQFPNQRNFNIVGIFDSGYKEFDELYIFTDIRHLQRMNKWEVDEVGNFEVFLKDFDLLEEKSNEIRNATLSSLDSSTIKDKYGHIFEWIALFDFNAAGIIAIMIIVGGINMITALLVLILERTQMIGVLKSLGSSDWSIRKIFLYNATYLISIGLFWGNLIGLGLLWIQAKYQIFKFPNPEEYYISYIPVDISFLSVLFLNIGVLLLCILMLLLPSYIITKITPVKAMKFE